MFGAKASKIISNRPDHIQKKINLAGSCTDENRYRKMKIRMVKDKVKESNNASTGVSTNLKNLNLSV